MDREKIIEWADKCTSPARGSDDCNGCPYHLNHEGFYSCIECLMRDTVVILKEQEPKTPIHIHEEYPEHDWVTDKDGNIDEWVMSYEFHNGPGCKRCGYSFCVNCRPNGWNEKQCVIDYYQCPKCKERIFKQFKNIEYCVNCGQAVKWE